MTEPLLPAREIDMSTAWWEQAICYLIIAWSAAFVLMPWFRGIQPLNLAAAVLFIGWGARRLMRHRRDGLLGMTPAQLYQAAKAGRRLRTNPLETATVAAFALTTAVQMLAAWP